MKISGVAKKGLALVMTMALTVGAVAVAPSEASAAKKKSAKVTVRALFAATTKKPESDCAWLYGDGSDKNKQSKTTVTLTKGKKVPVTITLKKLKNWKDDAGKSVKTGTITGATVLTVDLVDVMKSFKKVKVSGLSVTADGKKVGCKLVQGQFEPSEHPNYWRVSLYNKWGNVSKGDTSRNVNKPNKFKFKNTLTIKFYVTAK